MRKLLLPLFLLPTLIFAQQKIKMDEIPLVEAIVPTISELNIQDEADAKNGQMYRIGKSVSFDINLMNDGIWWQDGDMTIYQVRYKAEGALGTNILFDQFTLPEGAELMIYNDAKTQSAGPYTSAHNSEDGLFSSSIVTGESGIIEIHIPKDASGDLNVHINELGYFYRGVQEFEPHSSKDLGDSESCEVNVNCSPVGDSWQDEKKGVARILVKEGSSYGLCSGSLINNKLNDCTPYFLTAQHCGAAATLSDKRLWQFYFKYEANGCTDPASEPSSSGLVITGGFMVSSSGTISDVQRSDFILLILKTRPTATMTGYFNGWDRTNTGASGGAGIHHPAGDIKKISTYTGTLTSGTWSTPNAHWRVVWTSNANGHGVTEGGSSGSPIFNNSGRIVGDLSGGSSFCSSPSSPDLYGKIYYSWDLCGTTNQLRLKPWLDRTNVGGNTLDGKDLSTCPAATPPVVDFTADDVTPTISQVVTLTNSATNSPFAFEWLITPATHTYVGGTNKYSPNPQVTFSATGSYTVLLTAANTAGYNIRNKPGYIIVGAGGVGLENETNIPIEIYPNPASQIIYIKSSNSNWDIEKLNISLMDLSGKVIISNVVNSLANNTFSVEVPSSLSNGIYMIRISDGMQQAMEKVLIQK